LAVFILIIKKYINFKIPFTFQQKITGRIKPFQNEKTYTLFLLFVLTVAFAKAQDVHYSQFYYSPFTLNPALAGSMDGQYRFGGIYKNQWGSITSPYVYSTPSISGDVKLFNGGYNYNFLGLGLMLLNDRSGDGNLTNLTAMLSASYHQQLDKEGNYHIAIGLMGGIVQKKIDFANLDFYDEFTGLDFGGITSEHFDYYQIAYPDFSTGLSLDGVISSSARFQSAVLPSMLPLPRNRSFRPVRMYSTCAM
jgi:type IX secretion system PorP/SprF family membrane protein